MSTRFFLVGMVCAALLRSASADQPSPQRLAAIWGAVDDRVSKQIDAWFDDGDFPKSINLLKFEAAYDPHDYDVVTNLGWMQENVEEWDAALATYDLYLNNNPNDRDRALPKATFLFMRKQYSKIPDLLEPYIKLKPHPNVYRTLAHSYEKLNRYEDAKRIWIAYVAVAPKDLQGQANLRKVERKLAAMKKSL